MSEPVYAWNLSAIGRKDFSRFSTILLDLLVFTNDFLNFRNCVIIGHQREVSCGKWSSSQISHRWVSCEQQLLSNSQRVRRRVAEAHHRPLVSQHIVRFYDSLALGRASGLGNLTSNSPVWRPVYDVGHIQLLELHLASKPKNWKAFMAFVIFI